MSLALTTSRARYSLRSLAPLRRFYAAGPPPPPRPYKPAADLPPKPEPKPLPTSNPSPPKPQPEPKDPERGARASQRVIEENKLDPRYKPAARKVNALICAIPVAIVMSVILYKRLVLGEEQRQVIRRDESENGKEGTVKFVTDEQET